MQITDVRIRKVEKEGKMKAVASITIDNEFVVHDIKIIDGDKGLFIAMPSKKTLDGEYRDIAHPINSSTRENIQKIILGRAMELDGVRMLIFDEPTQGIDIGAKFEIYQKIRTFVENKENAAIFVSSELDELITVCDRIYIFAEGSVSGEFRKDEFDKSKLLESAIRRNENAK